MSNYATDSDLKTQQVSIYRNCLKNDLGGLLKPDIDKLDIGKLETTPADLSKLSIVVEKEVVKKDVHDELVKKS